MRPYRCLTSDEFAAAYELFYKDREAGFTLAKMTIESAGGINYDPDHLLYSVLATLSDDCAIRVGRLRGQTPEEALAWVCAAARSCGPPLHWPRRCEAPLFLIAVPGCGG